jgi:IstB-like ATP binding protein
LELHEIAGKGLARRDEIYPLIASLLRAERTHRQARSISYRIVGAKFPVLKDLDKYVFADTPVDEGQVRELATGTFLDAKRNAIFIGGTAHSRRQYASALRHSSLSAVGSSFGAPATRPSDGGSPQNGRVLLALGHRRGFVFGRVIQFTVLDHLVAPAHLIPLALADMLNA